MCANFYLKLILVKDIYRRTNIKNSIFGFVANQCICFIYKRFVYFSLFMYLEKIKIIFINIPRSLAIIKFYLHYESWSQLARVVVLCIILETQFFKSRITLL